MKGKEWVETIKIVRGKIWELLRHLDHRVGSRRVRPGQTRVWHYANEDTL